MYNYGYPTYYQPPMPDQLAQLRGQYQPMQPMQNQQQVQSQQLLQNTQQQAANSMIWVQGEAGAKSYLVANGNTVPLWDSENQTVYIKTVDASGMPSMRVLDYTERTAPRMPQNETKRAEQDYVTRGEYNALAERVGALESVPAKKKALKEETDG